MGLSEVSGSSFFCIKMIWFNEVALKWLFSKKIVEILLHKEDIIVYNEIAKK